MRTGDTVTSWRYPEMGVGIIERPWEGGAGFFVVVFTDTPHQTNIFHGSGLEVINP